MAGAEAWRETAREPDPVSAARPGDRGSAGRSRACHRAGDASTRGCRPNCAGPVSRSSRIAAVLGATSLSRSRRVLPAVPGAAVQHRSECLKDRAHLRRLVGKHLRRIHVVDNGGIVRLENQQFSALAFRAVDREIIEAYSIDDGVQGVSMANCEATIEGAHEVFFFAALAFAESHICVEIPDVPPIGYRHVATIWPAIDDDDTILAKQAIIVGVIDETRDEKFLLRSFREISADRGAIVDLGQSDARM